ncbi:Putative peptidoglycan binding domain-containing protein [Microbulbifer yueqingensis]|uniref:Putative peptidoglycan binding domain-containing protein n=2 Tax=Microbulbifer yueqingensis TaxID=658219 RepID=A0A1G8YDI7_9GAMM|nr:Putative peptidoglycan binding domain-containing protein [Microbulbifer yueqingensis]
MLAAVLSGTLAIPGFAVSPPADGAEAAARLRAEAERYRQMEAGWRPVDRGPPLQPGDRDKRVTQLRDALELLGDYHGLPGPVTLIPPDPSRFDSAVQTAVERFQRRHGLKPHGTVDYRTLRELAVSPATRARQLELNAQRWEKLPLPRKDRYVLVNIPEYRLQLIEGGREVLGMKTVVGKTSSRTPEITSRITNVVLNPTWTVPRSILLTELLPKARNNPEAMHNRGYRVVSYRNGHTAPISAHSIDRAADGHATLRQLSGPGNTLGRVKFVLPNRQSIYLHDTQAQSLFALSQRAFSHGCIRLERPEELAYALLERQGWDRTRIAQVTTGTETMNIRVEKPARLFIAYLTAWIDGDGRPQFRRDIYHHDRSETTPE